MQYMNRFNWIGQQQHGEDSDETYMLCENQLPSTYRCSHIYKKNTYSDDTCPVCGSYAAIDIHKEQNLDSTLNEIGLHRLFFDRVAKVYEEMDLSVWSSLGGTAWKTANAKEQIFLSFCKAFGEVSGEATRSESQFWDVALKVEADIRGYLVENKLQLTKQENFELSLIADGMLAGKEIRTLQAHYGISLCGEVFQTHSVVESERKYQKALKVAERLAVMGCSAKDNLPYFNAADHLSKRS